MGSSSTHLNLDLQSMLILFTTLCIVNAALVLPKVRTTGLGCIPEGETVSYECTVTDTTGSVALTIWLGDAFDCPPRNQISLLHSQFPGASGACGTLKAEAIRVDGNEYTSQLKLTASTELDGKMINCSHSGATLVESDTLKVGVRPHAPKSLSVMFMPSPASLNVNWSPPYPPSVPVVDGVGGYMFTVTGVGCGCVSTNVSADTTNVMCTGWELNGQTCSFEVRTVSEDCGFTSDPDTSSILLSVECDPEQLGDNPTSSISRGSVTVANGIVSYNGVTPQSTATVTCENGFRPGEENLIRRCMTDGIWSGNLQSCEVEQQSLAWITAPVLIVLGILLLLVVLVVISPMIVFKIKDRQRQSRNDPEVEMTEGCHSAPVKMSSSIDPVVHGHVAYFRPYQSRNIYKCELLDDNQNPTWTELNECPVRSPSLALIPIKGVYNLYTVGGEELGADPQSKTFTNKLYYWNETEWVDAKDRFPSMEEARSRATVVLHGSSHLIVAGGKGPKGPTNTVEILDLSADILEWKTAAKLPESMFRASGHISNDYLYLFGGHCMKCAVSTPMEEGYRASLTTLITSCSGHNQPVFEKVSGPPLRGSAFVCISNRIFAIGGAEDITALCSKDIYEYRFNPTDNNGMWEKKDNTLSIVRSYPFAVVFAESEPNVIVVGGYYPRHRESATHRYEFVNLT